MHSDDAALAVHIAERATSALHSCFNLVVIGPFLLERCLAHAQIAEKELREKKIPFTVRRYLPDNTFEDWSVEELIQSGR